MANRWGIPKDVQEFVKQRDINCVYCGQTFLEKSAFSRQKPSWEHIVNDVRINGVDNISLCFMSCNASKGPKLLEDWLKSNYCKRNKITEYSVSQVVKDAIKDPPEIE